MSKKIVYVVRKDGLFLVSYRLSDIREFDGKGKLAEVYTCVWGESRKGARAFQHKAKAQEVMHLVLADGIEEVVTEVDDDGDENCT